MREPIVLAYHAVTRDWDVQLAVTPERLEQQLRRLMRFGYRPARFTDALLEPRHDRTFVVTFDDAYRSVLSRAAPILEGLGVRATLFVPTGWVGEAHREGMWEGMPRWRRPGLDHELELMTWDEIRQLAARGWEIGSHTSTHPFLTRLDDAALASELTESRARIESEVAGPCRSVAYPYGDVDERVARAARRAGYATGASLMDIREFATRRHSTLLQWRRIGVYPVDRTVRFDVKMIVAASGTVGPSVPGSDVAALGRRGRLLPPGDGTPRVAVLVPCFNDGALAVEAVGSIVEAEAIEVVVIDDASTEPETATALAQLRAGGVTVLRHEVNRGLSAARRTGLVATTAPFVLPLDADDLLMPGALERLANRLDAEPTAAASFGDIEEFGTRSRTVSVPVALDAYRVAYRNDYPVSSLFRRTALEDVGGWQDVGGMVGYEDWSLWMSLAERGDTAVHAGPGFTSIRRRLHGPRMLGDSGRRHRMLYAELRRTHPQLFAELGAHRRRSALSRPRKLTYRLVFGGRPPLGLRVRWWEFVARLRRVTPAEKR